MRRATPAQCHDNDLCGGYYFDAHQHQIVARFSTGCYRAGQLARAATPAARGATQGQKVFKTLDRPLDLSRPGTGAPVTEGKTVVLGWDQYLDKFAAKHGGQKVLQLAEDPMQWKQTFLKVMNDPNNKIKFNLRGISDPLDSAARGATLRGGATDWELTQIYSNKDWWPRIEWYDHLGRQVPNPFK
jgi:hypothetical protein